MGGVVAGLHESGPVQLHTPNCNNGQVLDSLLVGRRLTWPDGYCQDKTNPTAPIGTSQAPATAKAADPSLMLVP